MRRGDFTPPYGCNADSAKQQTDVVIGPYEKEGKSPPPPASGAQRSVCASGREGCAAEIIPEGTINAGQSLSHGFAVPAPFTQGSLGTWESVLLTMDGGSGRRT